MEEARSENQQREEVGRLCGWDCTRTRPNGELTHGRWFRNNFSTMVIPLTLG